MGTQKRAERVRGSSVSWKRQGLQNKVELAKKRNETTLREGTSMSKGLRVRETLYF